MAPELANLPDAERNYRVAFRHGVRFAVAAVRRQMPPDLQSRLERWWRLEMLDWEKSDPEGAAPPRLPRFD